MRTHTEYTIYTSFAHIRTHLHKNIQTFDRIQN